MERKDTEKNREHKKVPAYLLAILLIESGGSSIEHIHPWLNERIGRRTPFYFYLRITPALVDIPTILRGKIRNFLRAFRFLNCNKYPQIIPE